MRVLPTYITLDRLTLALIFNWWSNRFSILAYINSTIDTSKQPNSTTQDYIDVFVCPGGCYAGQKEGSGEEGMLVSEEQASADSLATAAIMSDDPHAVLVEFSSVVADTQEYIIRVRPFKDGRGGYFPNGSITHFTLPKMWK